MKPKKTILCVDDNEQALSIRKVMLETRGYRVAACNNGQTALEVFRCGGIDLVLTDLIMPGLDGPHLIEEIKMLSPQTPAILISSRVKVLRTGNARRSRSSQRNARARRTAGENPPLARPQTRAEASR